ncbi:MAG: tRNA pseudouridine(38-40) synthase TruA [Oscillospiraceae bacterium]|nr:tRNA pseudouridine(38-40) synthase TruA [Oscillospiraceae bacterium]MCL2249647.1 tRNA pseudouridine(38-40) synthase TruA [Oscillospiraceae bacterium]
MKNIALKLSFVGTNYHGWQIQKTEKTVGGTLEAALAELCGHEVKLVGCGRTDAGVHAKIYCANFKTDSTIPLEKLPLAVNAILPADIVVEKAMYAPDDFNAILSCLKKQYTYRLYNLRIRNPFEAERAYFYPRKLNIEKMKQAARHFVGTHDFAAVRSVGTETKTTVRTVLEYEIEENSPIIEFRATADGFLYNMARAMVGTLLYVSEGKIDPAELPVLLEQKDRRLTGPTVPPDGLYMTKIWYDGEVGEMLL